MIWYNICERTNYDGANFGGSGKTPNIKVIFCHKPTEEVEFILNKIKETIMRGIRISKRLSIPMKNGLY